MLRTTHLRHVLLLIAATGSVGCGDGSSNLGAGADAADEIDIEEEPLAIFDALAATNATQRYNAYLTQAGFRDPHQLGSTKQVVACELRVFQGAFTFNRGRTESCVWQQSEPGWVIQSVSVDVKENFRRRGSYSYSVVATAGEFNMSVKEIGDKWRAAIEQAVKARDIEVKRMLEVDYQRHMERVLSLASNKNSLLLDATANGGIFARSRIHVVATVTLLRVE